MSARSFLNRKAGKLALGLSGLLASSSALAATNASDPFNQFTQTVQNWANGPLGVGLATSMLLIGAGIGVAKNSPLPALSGVAGAAFLHWGPGVISTMMGSGAVI
jgi:conjugal transfer pilus assembly protein TraA